jgi:hypothetical protein
MQTLPVFQPPVTRTVVGPAGPVGQAGPAGQDGQSVAVLDEGSQLTAAAASLDFVGAGVTATVAGSAVTVTIPGGGGGGGGGNAFIATGSNPPAVINATPVRLPFGTVTPGFTIDTAGDYILMARVRVDFSAWRSTSKLMAFSLERTNNTPAQLCKVEVNLPDTSAASVSHTYGIVMLPITAYTTANVDDVIELYGTVADPSNAGEIHIMEAEMVAVPHACTVGGISGGGGGGGG